MKLTVNGKAHEHQGDGSIADLLQECGANGDRVALLLNGAVLPKELWTQKKLTNHDAIELLVFAGGG